MKKCSILIAHKHTTSVSLEQEFLDVLKQMALDRNISLNEMVTRIDEHKEVENLSSAIRLFILKELIDEKNNNS